MKVVFIWRSGLKFFERFEHFPYAIYDPKTGKFLYGSVSEGEEVLLVDDEVASGMTLFSTITFLKEKYGISKIKIACWDMEGSFKPDIPLPQPTLREEDKAILNDDIAEIEDKVMEEEDIRRVVTEIRELKKQNADWEEIFPLEWTLDNLLREKLKEITGNRKLYIRDEEDELVPIEESDIEKAVEIVKEKLLQTEPNPQPKRGKRGPKR